MEKVENDVLPNPDERILALDVVRGFALFGIFLMNVEWFNRAFSEMQLGVPLGLTGADWWASRLIYLFVQGKFWTIFSLLFGMGFAVMLGRAEKAGRAFLPLYLRRILGLAIFGTGHFILLWNGDILFSYALAALALLILLYGKWKPILAALLTLAGLGFIPGLSPVWRVAGGLAYLSVVALYLRGEKCLRLRGRRLPVFSFVILILGALTTLVTGVLWALPAVPREAKIPMSIISGVVLLLGFLSAKYHQPLEKRSRRLALALYLLPFLGMTTAGTVKYLSPPPLSALTWQAAGARSQPPVQAAAGEKKAVDAEAEKQAKKEAEKQKKVAELRARIQKETRVLSKGTYLDAVKFRAGDFPDKATQEAGFAMLVVSLFLLGAWFVQSGVMANVRDHLPLFRKLAYIALPLGVGLGLLGSAIATSHTPGDQRDGYLLASGLLYVGNLPACLGYVSVVVLLLQQGWACAWLRFLAPVGRMALTNYLLQTTVSVFFFFGHGLGHWGISRSRQVLYVVVVFALQVAFSHLWLRFFRYGPFEWLWRAFTYWRIPTLRVRAAGTARPVEERDPKDQRDQRDERGEAEGEVGGESGGEVEGRGKDGVEGGATAG